MRTRYLLLCAVCLTALYGCTQKMPVQGPSIHFSALSYDFGRVQQGTMVSHRYDFVNTGTDDLTIKDVFTSCGCTAASAFSGEVMPAGRGAIAARFDSSNYLGPVTKTISVSTNDPLKSMVVLTLTGRVVSDLVATPPIVLLGTVKRGSTEERRLTLSLSSPPVKVLSVTASKPYLKLTPGTQSITRDTYLVTLAPSAPVGPINSYVQISYKGTGAGQETKIVPVIGTVAGDILINPSEVKLGIVKRGVRHPAMEVFLYTQPNKAFAITRITTKPDVLRVKAFRQGTGSYRLELRPTGVGKTGKLIGEITVYTTLKSMPVVVVPFTGVAIQ